MQAEFFDKVFRMSIIANLGACDAERLDDDPASFEDETEMHEDDSMPVADVADPDKVYACSG